MDQNRDMEKIVSSSQGTSMKVKLILAAALIIMGLLVTATTFNVFQSGNASFVQDCKYQDEVLKTDAQINSEQDALKAIGPFSGSENLTYEQFPIEYYEDCHVKQYYFEDKGTQERFFVCKNGNILRRIPINCSMNYNFSIVDSASQMFKNKT
jgi:hypothetical protein